MFSQTIIKIINWFCVYLLDKTLQDSSEQKQVHWAPLLALSLSYASSSSCGSSHPWRRCCPLLQRGQAFHLPESKAGKKQIKSNQSIL